MANLPRHYPCMGDRSGCPLPKRKPNRLKNYDYAQNGAYFVTMCIQDRHEILGNIVVGATYGRPSCGRPRMELSEIGKIVETEIAQIPRIFNGIHIPCHVVMPNHVHMIIVVDKTYDGGSRDGGRPQVAPTVSRLIKQWKGVITKRIGFSPWQRSFHDHIIRNEMDYERIAEYIENNPANWESDCFFMDTNT